MQTETCLNHLLSLLLYFPYISNAISASVCVYFLHIHNTLSRGTSINLPIHMFSYGPSFPVGFHVHISIIRKMVNRCLIGGRTQPIDAAF